MYKNSSKYITMVKYMVYYEKVKTERLTAVDSII